MQSYLKLMPTALLNHLSWDLEPIQKSWLSKSHPDSCPKVISFCHTIYAVREIPEMLDSVDKMVVFSHFFEDQELEDALFSSKMGRKVIQIPSLFDEKAYHNKCYTDIDHTDAFVVGNITNGAPWKHSEDFPGILSAINHKIPSVKFQFLGAKDLLGKINDGINFEILPPFSIPVSDYLQKVDVLIHKTRADIIETWCRVVTEAMFAGVPVVAEKKGGIREQIIHGETGFLCDTPDDFVKYINLLFSDPDCYQQISQQAKRFAIKNYGYDASRKNLLKLINE